MSLLLLSSANASGLIDNYYYQCFYRLIRNDHGEVIGVQADSAIILSQPDYYSFIEGDVEIPTSFTTTIHDYNVTFPVVGVQYNAFLGCNLTSFSMHSSMKFYYLDYAYNRWKPTGVLDFRGCRQLTTVNLPNTITQIGGLGPDSVWWTGFPDCISLTQIDIPNSVTTIGEAAFRRCSSLTSVTIPGSVTSIGDWAFEDCSSLTSIDIPNSVTTIGKGAFRGCSSLTSVTIGNSATTIGNYPFRGCTGIETVYWNVRNFETEKDPYCFYYYLDPELFSESVSLRRIYIGSDVQSIVTSGLFAAFYMEDDVMVDVVLDTVTSYAVVPPVLPSHEQDTPLIILSDLILPDHIFSNATYANAVLCVPKESLQAYREAPGWKEFFHIVAIGEQAVAGDVDGDGQVGISDVTALIDYLLIGSVSSESDPTVDIDGDGKIGISDVTALIDYLLSGTW